ncbi:MAG TPA: PAS domain S-box protein [Vicinamibacterales bacterium]|nr:PAS domain S-box protein [Vicinamibacterales bacterium]
MSLNSPPAIALLDLIAVPALFAAVPSGRVLRWNQSAAAYCGVEFLSSATLAELIKEGLARDTTDVAPEALERALTDGTPLTDIHATLIGRDRLPVAVSLQPAEIDGNRGVVVLCYPTTRWVEARAHADHAEKRLAVALSAAGLGSWEFDLHTRVLMASPQCRANHGFGPDEDMQLEPHILDTLHGEHRALFVSTIERAIQTHGSFEIQLPNMWRDGTEHWVLIAGRVVDATSMVGVSQDITQRHAVEQALRDSEQQYRALVETANEGIWRVDQDARITFVNRRMADLLRITPEDMVGRHKWEFVFDEDVAAMQGLFDRRRQGVSEERADIRFRRGDGREIWTLMSARPLYDERGSFTGAVDLFTDITDRRRWEQELRDADRRKDEFLAVLAHELRGPIAPIVTAVKLLQAKGPKEPSLERFRQTILRQATQLSTLVEDLLDIGRITAGKIRLEKTRVDLRDVVKQAVETSMPLIERHQHRLEVQVPDEPAYVEADAARLAQVAANLLNNAAKYSADGGQIEVRLTEEQGMGVVSVRDQGVGIPLDMIDRIFDRFIQVGTSGHRAEGGLGIGLSIVKALVELHGGSVEVRSDGIGKGSEFSFRVPLAAAGASV